MNKKVTVIGVGRLGLSFAALLGSKGYDVMGCDINERYIEQLNEGTFESKEPFVQSLLNHSTIQFTTNAVKSLAYSDLIFVFVPTPSKEGGDYSHKYVDQIVDKILFNKIDNKTLVIGSTVMPYYCESIEKKLIDLNINVIYNPEFIAQGSIIDGLENADMVLIGGSNIPQELLDIYCAIMKKEPNFKMLSLVGAGICKIAINCFLTLKVAYANMIGEIIINSYEEENIKQIMEAIGSDSRIGDKYLSYGFPAGGVCLPRDQKALNHHAYRVGIPTDFLNAIDTENNRHSQYLCYYYSNKNPDRNIPFVFSYLGYKKGVDILTDSFQLKLCIDLLRMGYKVSVPAYIRYESMPEEFKDYVYNDKVIFEEIDGYKIN